MHNYHNKKKNIISLFLILLLIIAIGYAYLTSNLSINGSTEIANNTWDIHFENVQVNENSVAIESGGSAATINPSNNGEVTYSVKLNKPGDFYEFTVDVKNDGTLDGMINTINSTLKINNGEPFVIASDNSNLPAYLDYSIKYSDDTEIMPNHRLNAGKKETYKIRVEFKEDIDVSLLPSSTNQFLTFNLRMDMVQANITSTPAIHTIREIKYAVVHYEDDLSIDKDVSDVSYLRSTPEEARNDWLTFSNGYGGVAGVRKPYYIKVILENNIVKELYLELVIDDEYLEDNREAFMANCYNNTSYINSYKAPNKGVYTFRGGIDEQHASERTVYEANTAEEIRAYGEDNCAQASDTLRCGSLNHNNYMFGLYVTEVSYFGGVATLDGDYLCSVGTSAYCQFYY